MNIADVYDSTFLMLAPLTLSSLCVRVLFQSTTTVKGPLNGGDYLNFESIDNGSSSTSPTEPQSTPMDQYRKSELVASVKG